MQIRCDSKDPLSYGSGETAPLSDPGDRPLFLTPKPFRFLPCESMPLSQQKNAHHTACQGPFCNGSSHHSL